MLSHGLQRPRALRTPAYHRDPKTTRVAAMRVTRAAYADGKLKLGSVRGRFHKLRLAETPPHPDLLPARGEKE